MKIRYCGPVKGRRELLCVGDEARVSRLHTHNKYDGMVERLSPVSDIESRFVVHFGGNFDLSFYSSRVSYHLFKFLSLSLAKCLYPENIVNAPETRFFRRNGKLFAATYSDFVPDETGVIPRRAETMSKFYASPDDLRDAVRSVSDAKEHSLNPKLGAVVANLHSAGLYPPHPEANYHLTAGRTVFFEISEIELPTVYQRIISLDDKFSEAHRIFAMICAVVAKCLDILPTQDLHGLTTIFDSVSHRVDISYCFKSVGDFRWLFRNSARHTCDQLPDFLNGIDRRVVDTLFETPK